MYEEYEVTERSALAKRKGERMLFLNLAIKDPSWSTSSDCPRRSLLRVTV